MWSPWPRFKCCYSCLHEHNQLSYPNGCRFSLLPSFSLSCFWWTHLLFFISNPPLLSNPGPPASLILTPEEIIALELSEPISPPHSCRHDHCSELATNSCHWFHQQASRSPLILTPVFSRCGCSIQYHPRPCGSILSWGSIGTWAFLPSWGRDAFAVCMESHFILLVPMCWCLSEWWLGDCSSSQILAQSLSQCCLQVIDEWLSKSLLFCVAHSALYLLLTFTREAAFSPEHISWDVCKDMDSEVSSLYRLILPKYAHLGCLFLFSIISKMLTSSSVILKPSRMNKI